jgi:pimeloyl-ACP methyl ester carboxylesterase
MVDVVAGERRMFDRLAVRDLVPRWQNAVALAALSGLMAGCGGGSATPPADFAGQLALGNGRTLYMECRGSGSPTVILVAGLGERADNWMSLPDSAQAGQAVYPAVAKFSRVCAYDRPGTATGTATGWELSRSTQVQHLATVKDSAADLNLLLAASGEAAPYVLVGHSLGGPIIRLYAADHPANVAGLVFDDGLSEDLGDGLTPEQLANFERLNDPATQGRPAGSEETFYSAAVVPQLRAAAPPPKVPIIVLSADTWLLTADAIRSGNYPPFVDQAFSDALWASQLAAQDKLAARLPGAKHISQTHAPHYIHLFNPQVVTDAIFEVVDAARSAPAR